MDALTKFDISSIKPRSSIFMFDRFGGLAKYVIQDILIKKPSMVFGSVFAPISTSRSYYKSWLPKTWVYDDYHPTYLLKLLQYADAHFINDLQTFMVFDNCIYDTKDFLSSSSLLRHLVFKLHNHRRMSIFTFHSIFPMSLTNRSSIDYVFFFYNPHERARRCMYEQYFKDRGLTFEEFCALFENYTEYFPGRCLVLDQTIPTEKYQECLFCYTADLSNPFQSSIIKQFSSLPSPPPSSPPDASEEDDSASANLIV